MAHVQQGPTKISQQGLNVCPARGTFIVQNLPLSPSDAQMAPTAIAQVVQTTAMIALQVIGAVLVKLSRGVRKASMQPISAATAQTSTRASDAQSMQLPAQRALRRQKDAYAASTSSPPTQWHQTSPAMPVHPTSIAQISTQHCPICERIAAIGDQDTPPSSLGHAHTMTRALEGPYLTRPTTDRVTRCVH
eukprot:CAMPEP_0115883652 /NCGR_PEP_ID=MMETSP0287-20121206/29681_1 /TAXON_ID=412157 /ORGANISM="Chrysochromulina rotalis, Strain UIO044" /LENGTH=190 /DNA_ID=CAMNT_0003339869 /DNA_START=276 /DNA_END=846 /DNA_ORIENTATION=+